MHRNATEFLPGDWVEVKSPEEIAQTLDADGTLDNLPFMPEMVEYCGRRFRMRRQAEKTCLEDDGGEYLIREFRNNDVVFLEGLRCPGSSHDGCQRMCTFFWKKSWLRKVETGEPAAALNREAQESLLFRLKTMTGPDRYFCQSTELAKAVKSQPLTRLQILAKCVRDVRSGAIGFRDATALVSIPLYRKVRDYVFGRPRLEGSLTRTPVGTLGLQPGEIVEIKTLKEMQATLDRNGRNRGLICDIELGNFCGRKYRVRGRLDRMISEATGKMRKVEGTVLLDGNLCMCARALGGCPRMEFCYWREIWLKRVEPEPLALSEHPPALAVGERN